MTDRDPAGDADQSEPEEVDPRASALLREDGGALLREDGGALLLEGDALSAEAPRGVAEGSGTAFEREPAEAPSAPEPQGGVSVGANAGMAEATASAFDAAPAVDSATAVVTLREEAPPFPPRNQQAQRRPVPRQPYQQHRPTMVPSASTAVGVNATQTQSPSLDADVIRAGVADAELTVDPDEEATGRLLAVIPVNLLPELEVLLGKFHEALQAGEFGDGEEALEAAAELQTLDAQARSPKPKRISVRAALTALASHATTYGLGVLSGMTCNYLSML